MASVLFFPSFPDRPRLLDQLFRAVWHFLPAVQKLDRLVFPYCGDDFALLDAEQVLATARAYIGRDFDPAIATYATRYTGKITFAASKSADLKDLHASALADLKLIMVWDLSHPRTAALAKRIGASTGAEVVLADPALVQQETLVALRAAHKLFDHQDQAKLVSDSYRTFTKHLASWKGKGISVFGNGPSLSNVVRMGREITTPLRAVCNSTIGDAAALSYLTPQLLFCGDPVQHCGASLYAGRFREDLAKAMADPTRVLLTQLGYVPYFREALDVGRDRIIGIGNDRRSQFNTELDKEFLTAATANIFTMLVLPVAFTVSQAVDIYGCDGMSFAAATKPWSHANETDYMGKMAVTHRVHPGFWKRNYEEEFWSYCRDMEDILAIASARGIKVRARTPSYVPALAKRFVM